MGQHLRLWGEKLWFSSRSGEYLWVPLGMVYALAANCCSVSWPSIAAANAVPFFVLCPSIAAANEVPFLAETSSPSEGLLRVCFPRNLRRCG